MELYLGIPLQEEPQLMGFPGKKIDNLRIRNFDQCKTESASLNRLIYRPFWSSIRYLEWGFMLKTHWKFQGTVEQRYHHLLQLGK